MAIALLIAQPAEVSHFVPIGFKLARQLDKPLVVLCIEASPNVDESDVEKRFANRHGYADAALARMAELSQAGFNREITADVLEIPPQFASIRVWLLSSQSTEALGRFSIETLFIPRTHRTNDKELQSRKDTLFALSPCETVHLCVDPLETEAAIRLKRIGCVGSNARELTIARHFARRLDPAEMVDATDEIEADLDGIVIGVNGSSGTARLAKNPAWKTVLTTSTVAGMAVNPADSLLERLNQRIDDATRKVFAEYQMTRSDREQLADNLQAGTRASPEFVLFMIVATSLASIGLIQDSAAVIIGAMLVAPLMTPLLGAGLAMIQGNIRLLNDAIRATLVGVSLSLLIGTGIGFVVMVMPGRLFLDTELRLTDEMISRSHPNLLDPLIGLAAGLAGGFALGRDKRLGAVAGVAIAAALVPPIATAGLEASIVCPAILQKQIALHQLFMADSDTLVAADLVAVTHKPFDRVSLIAGPFILFAMNACTVVTGAFLGLRIVGMHRTMYPRKSRPWVVTVALLLGSAIMFFVCVAFAL